MNEEKIWAGMLRGAMGGAIGGLIVLVFLGFMGDIFRARTGHDQAYLIMFIFYFTPPLLALGALTGAITGASVWWLAKKRQNSPGLIKRLLLGVTCALLLGALVALYFAEGEKTFEYWIHFTLVVMVFGIAVGGLAGTCAGRRKVGGKPLGDEPHSSP